MRAGHACNVRLNLKQPAGRDVLDRLAAQAEVLLRGLPHGRHRSPGHDYPTLAAVNLRPVYCSISGYGQDGPYRGRVGGRATSNARVDGIDVQEQRPHP